MVLSSAIVCDHDRRIADDRRSSFHMIADDRRPYCDLRSAICDPRSYGNQPLDRTWFYLLRSSAITIAGSQTIADFIAICDHMETSLKKKLDGCSWCQKASSRAFNFPYIFLYFFPRTIFISSSRLVRYTGKCMESSKHD